jgi:hypothetical protein
MLGDRFEVLVLLTTSLVMSIIGHSRSTRYERTSLVVGVLSTAVWFAVVVARHHNPAFLLNSMLTARVSALFMIVMAITAAMCAVVIAHCVSLFFGVRGKTGIGLGTALLAFFLILFLKACTYSSSGGPSDPL